MENKNPEVCDQINKDYDCDNYCDCFASLRVFGTYLERQGRPLLILGMLFVKDPCGLIQSREHKYV